MKEIKHLADEIKDELCSAKDYANEYVKCKAEGKTQWAQHFHEMAQDEIKHAKYLHDFVVEKITKLREIYKPPEKMLEKWEHDHKHYIWRECLNPKNARTIKKQPP